MQAVTWTFAFIYNRHYGLSGSVFKKSYGNDPKLTQDDISDNCIYIANNPIKKRAVTSARDYRWNFLRYYNPANPSGDGPTRRLFSPFSEPYDFEEASDDMRYLVKKVRKMFEARKAVTYEFFQSKRYNALSEKEQRQLADIIISSYNVLDYSVIIGRWGSLDAFFAALDQYRGKEYNVSDDWDMENYMHYYQMIRISMREGYDMRESRAAGLDGKFKIRLARLLKSEVGATDKEIRKFLDL